MHDIDNMNLETHWTMVREIYAEGLSTGLAAFMGKPTSRAVWDAAQLTFGRLVAW